MNLFTKDNLINILTSGKEFKDLHFHYVRTHTESEGMHANSTTTLHKIYNVGAVYIILWDFQILITKLCMLQEF